MRFSVVAFSIALVGFVSAQSISNVPACAANCTTTLLPASCNLNPECICKDSNFISSISCCVFQACPAADQANALNFAKTICTPVGVTLPTQAGCGNTTSATNSTSSASSSSATSSAAAATTTSRAAGERMAAAQGIGLVGVVLGAVALL